MAASSRGYSAAASLLRSSRHPRICTECISTLVQRAQPQSRRHYAVAAAQIQRDSPASPSTGPNDANPSATSKSKVNPEPPPYLIKSGILLSRPPLLTRELHPFEEAFFFYQKRLNERLVLPFTRYFYFKKGTPADSDWKLKAKARNGASARDLGGYQAYGELGWNDEILVGDKTHKKEVAIEALLKDSVVRVNEDGTMRTLAEGEEEETLAAQRPLPRKTESDKTGDETKLDRALDRTLYLVVKQKDGSWVLPSATLEGRENLHQAAERILVQSAGVDMNTWIIGNAPVGHHVLKAEYSQPSEGSNEASTLTKQGEKTFFMKGRIMAGQAKLTKNLFGLEQFKWLTKEEVGKHVLPSYFRQVKNMMADR